jgi:hypothetical protein
MRSVLYKSTILALALSLCYATSSFAGDCCVSDAKKDINDCIAEEAKTSGANDATGQQGMSSKPATSAGGDACNTQNQQNNTASPAANKFAEPISKCQEDMKDCVDKCSKEMQKPECGSTPGSMINMCNSIIPSKIAGMTSAAQALSSAAAGAATSASQGCGGKPPQLPQMPPQQQGSNNSPTTPTTPTAQTASTNATPAATGPTDITDGGSPAGFPGLPTGAGGSGSPGSATITQLANPYSGAGAAAPAGATGGGGGSSSSGSGALGKQEVNPNDALEKAKAEALKKMMAEGKGSGRSPANEYGNEGGGGGGATGMGESSVDLSEFLPGGKKDPTKNKDAKGMGGASIAPAHPDIVAKSGDMFGNVSKRMHIMCDMKELIGCN